MTLDDRSELQSSRLYVLRVWCEPGGGGPRAWRASVGREGGLRRSFVSLDALVEFLGVHLDEMFQDEKCRASGLLAFGVAGQDEKATEP